MTHAKLAALVLSGALKSYECRRSPVDDGEYGVQYAYDFTLTFPNGETLNLELDSEEKIT